VSRRKLSEAELDRALAELEWAREGEELVKTVVLPGFTDALAWVNAVGALAEEQDHHPDIWISWNRVTLRLTTHSAGALTEADVELARAIDAMA